ncbi:hypothetical protein [Lentibacillus daqui]|uniref:hypothetical protein n=1 Tax=Lentibacillus daqui TaxID=2911514 RepID=UPI0022B0A0A8|nr:hypothetical protein [Lentibacillus daqui]
MNTAYEKLSKIEIEIEALEKKKNKLIDMRIEGSLDKETYQDKYNETIKNLDDKKRRNRNERYFSM